MSLKSAIEQNQRAILELTDPELARLLPVLKELKADSERVLAKFLAREDAEASYTLTKHAQLVAQLDKVIATAERKIPWAMQIDLRTGVVETSKDAIGNLLEMINAGERKFAGSATNLRLNVTKIVSSSSDALMHRHRSSALRYAGRVGDMIRGDFLTGVVRGESVGQIAKRLLRGKYSDDPSVTAERVAQKQFFRNEADATRLVRTELNHGYNRLQQDGLEEANEEDPGWGKMWDATHDRRLCVDCRAMHGEWQPVRRLFSCGVLYPPLHPNDRCGTLPWRMNWPREKGKFATEYEESGMSDPIKGLRRAASRVEPIVPAVIEYEPGSRRAEARVRRLAAKIRDK